ncbi:GNAT family N-acetyltransferase [Caulobacter sp. KR2-114]|uniref:GNAT family N-acetyltransferase n=1 Tax=Caulobacter sp. KR2-114 TaxID=3400912 RepID=UPI003C01A267
MTVPPEICAVALEAAGVRLEPLGPQHREGLAAAADHEVIWAHMPAPAHGDNFGVWFEAALAIARAGREAVWAVRTLADGALVGSTRYLAIEPAHRRVEVGHTWYTPAVWATAVNPACKFALFRYGFEVLGLNRIELKTDNRNTRSQAAIAKLGATREGVFRAHMVRRDGSLRDSVYFSVVRSDWPAVRQRLATRLGIACPALSE